MFTAYFDASGKRQQSVLTVSGFVSDVRKWSKFDAEWDAILMAEGLNCFHMTDFVARKNHMVVGDLVIRNLGISSSDALSKLPFATPTKALRLMVPIKDLKAQTVFMKSMSISAALIHLLALVQ